MIRTLQLIILSNLVNCPFPPHASVFFEGCILFANMDILDGEEIYREKMIMKATDAYDDNYDRFGIGDQNFIYNSGSYFVIQFGIITYFLLRSLLNSIAKTYNWIPWCRKMGIKSYENSYTWKTKQGSLKLFLEGYFDLMLCSLLQIIAIYTSRENPDDLHGFFEGFNNWFCFVLTCFYSVFLIVFPVFGIYKVCMGGRRN